MEVTLEKVLNFIETTPSLEDLPTISDALTNRYADELGLYIEDTQAKDESSNQDDQEESTNEEEPTDSEEESNKNLPPFSF